MVFFDRVMDDNIDKLIDKLKNTNEDIDIYPALKRIAQTGASPAGSTDMDVFPIPENNAGAENSMNKNAAKNAASPLNRAKNMRDVYSSVSMDAIGNFIPGNKIPNNKIPGNKTSKYTKNGKKKKRSNKKTPGEIIAAIFISVLITASLAGAGIGIFFHFWNNSLQDPNVVWTNEPEDNTAEITNFLLMGVHGDLSDIVLIVSLDNGSKTLKLLQVPRDAYVGDLSPSGKLNAIYGIQEETAAQRVSDAILSMFQIRIHHYITLDLKGFRRIVDSMGGIEVDVPYTVSYGGYTVEEGKRKLDGKHAEIFIRVRKAFTDSDYGRMRSQRVFFDALFKKFFTMDEIELVSAAPVLLNYMQSNLSPGELMKYAKRGKTISKENIHFFTAGGTEYRYSKGGARQSAVALNQTEICDLLNEHFRPYSAKATLEQLNIYGTNENRSDFSNKDGTLEDPIGENENENENEESG
ncbi:MAG: LCP family protein [Oscillospiraceae bacterium]|nr:LCP family protein [Oscillospiraceae bacterium]